MGFFVQIRGDMNREYSRILNGETSVEDAFDAIEREVNELDWILTRGLVAGYSRIVPALAPDGMVLSDHDLATVDCGPAWELSDTFRRAGAGQCALQASRPEDRCRRSCGGETASRAGAHA